MSTDPESRIGRPFHYESGKAFLEIDVAVYRLSAVQKTAYRFAERCTAVLGALEGQRLPVTLVFRQATPETEASETVRLFFEDLLDQELREKIGDETRAIRSLIIAQAFSRTDLIRRE